MSSTHSALYTGSGTDVMLQGFTWGTQGGTYAKLNSSAQAIADAGFTMVWFPPPSSAPDFAPQGYIPVRWELGISGTTPATNYFYGSQDELKGAISALHARGVKALADIVINHRGGASTWADFQSPSFGTANDNNAGNNSCVAQGDEYWSTSGSPGNGLPNDQRGAADTGEPYAAARDLDHTKSQVQNAIKSWLTYLKDSNNAGFDGWRYDFVKGFGGTYVGQYNDSSAPFFSVGEFWPTNTFGTSPDWRTQITNWIAATGNKSAAFDFVTKPLLQDAVNGNTFGGLNNGGAPAGVIGVAPAFAVTFLDNHDTGPAPGGQGHWPFASNIEEGYAYILTHPGTPSVFWAHYFDQGASQQAKIKTMIGIRKSQGITSTSSISIKRSEGGLYAAVVNGNTAVKLGSNDWSPAAADAPSGSSWTLAVSGTNYAIWTAGGTTPPPTDGGSTGPTANNPSMFLRGTMSATIWDGSQPMTLVANNTWQRSVTLAANTTYQYKFEVSGSATSWAANWGAGSSAGVAQSGAGNISYTSGAAGSYVFTFNDSTLAYTVTAPAVTPTAPAAPAAVSAAATSSTTITVSFSASTGATSYTIARATGSSTTFAPVGTVTSTATGTLTFGDTGLTASTAYSYKVSATNATGTSALSTVTGTATTQAPPVTLPTSPTTVGATATSSSSITVTWSGGTGATSYTVYRALTNNSVGDFSPVASNLTGASFVDSSLLPSTTYFYRVQAVNNAGPAAVSTAFASATTQASTQPPPAVPLAPTGVTAAANAGSVVVSWTAVTGATSYSVSRAPAATGPFTVLSSTITATTFTDTTVAASTTYFYVVGASNAVGPSASSVVVSVTTPAAPTTCASVPVIFRVRNANTVMGQNLYVVGAVPGSTTLLGNWNPVNSVALTIQAPLGANSVWMGTVNLPPNTAIQYKYIKRNPSTGQVIWQADQATASRNRQATTGACGTTTSLDLDASGNAINF